MSPRAVLVTGAGGFIGAAVARRLAAERPVAAGLRRPGVGAVACDLDRPDTLAPAMAGAGAVVHAAVGAPERMADQLARLLAAADAAGIERFVHFSSIAVYGERSGPVREADGPLGRLGGYGQAKRDCEAALAAWVAAGPGRRAVILRPGIVYGPGSPLWIDGLIERIGSGALGDLGARGEGRAALIHVADVAEAVARALDLMESGAGPGPWPLPLNLVGPDRPTWNAYFRALAAAAGLAAPRRLRGLPLRQAASLPLKILARRGLPVPAGLARTPLPGEVRLFARAADYATERAQETLGWAPTVRLADGLAGSLPGRAAGV